MAKVAAESRYALASTGKAEDAINAINKNLSGLNLDRFVTILLAVLDRKTNTLTYVNGGHMPPVVRRTNGEVELLESESGLPIGILEDQEYPANQCRLAPGEVVIMFTDGINEAMNSAGEQFTTEAIIKEIEISQVKTPEAVNQVIRSALAQHMGTEKAIDDMCLVTLCRK